jgi:hypothetical protein
MLGGRLVGRKDSSMLPKNINWVIDPSILRMKDKGKKGRILDFSSSFVNTMITGSNPSIDEQHLPSFCKMKVLVRQRNAVRCYLTRDKRGLCRLTISFWLGLVSFIIKFDFKDEERPIKSITC